ncbi:hypothetical protein [Kribbella ginsengisoli]|uniref:DUF4232 domain-containing protein n=1 Tax=Kribbella ginsengisoli TaxID=363865 RepID=A0ABP6Z5J8_9ACTN
MNWGKLIGIGIIGCCLLGGSTGCGPRRSAAVMGLSVDDAGQPVMVLQDCQGVIDEIEFYDLSVAPSNPTVGSTPVVEYTNPDPQKAVVTIPLAGGDGWKPSGPAPALQAAGRYAIKIWGDDHDWAALEARFTVADLKGLKPGVVRYRPLTNSPSAGGSPIGRTFSADGQDWYIVTPLGDFTPDDCS